MLGFGVCFGANVDVDISFSVLALVLMFWSHVGLDGYTVGADICTGGVSVRFDVCVGAHNVLIWVQSSSLSSPSQRQASLWLFM